MSILSRAFVARGVFLSGSFLSSVRSKSSCDSKLKMSAGLLDNPLLKRDHLPLFSEIQSVHILPSVKSDLEKLKIDFKGISLLSIFEPFYLVLSLL
jgi:hypothetical protein